jgi:antitoxin (DNA-binding transcriptional repressor) of toxin-antitoxin stability system
MTLRPGSTGPRVLELQRSLVALGYQLPRWGADGQLGSETLTALALFLADHGRPVAEAPGEVTAADLELVAGLVAARATPPAEVVDLRAGAARTWARGRRPWSAVTGICLHQTACVLGERPARWASIGAHVGVTRAGQVLWLHDFTAIVVHGHGFNGSTVGIECDGRYEGVEGDLSTFWRPPGSTAQPQAPTPELIAAARAAIRWIVAEVARHGGQVARLVAHRQASADRRGDPGSALWRAVAMPMFEELGLDDGGPGYQIGTGLAIPEAWDPARRGVGY